MHSEPKHLNGSSVLIIGGVYNKLIIRTDRHVAIFKYKRIVQF